MLIPYTTEHFALLQSWVTDKLLLLQYAGPTFSFPLSQAQLEQYWQQHPDRALYLALTERTPYAFGEIIPQEPGSVRLARLLVGESRLRGRGLGTLLVGELLQEAQRSFGASSVDLYVFPNNAPAIRCYQKAGFTFRPGEERTFDFEGQTYTVSKMNIRLNSF